MQYHIIYVKVKSFYFGVFLMSMKVDEDIYEWNGWKQANREAAQFDQ